MQLENPVLPLSEAVGAAILRDLLPVEYPEERWEIQDGQRKRVQTGKMLSRRPDHHEVEFVMFAQTWGSTALGFGGVGGAAMTPAYTVVALGPMGDAAIYFAGRLAYHVKKPNQRFANHLSQQLMLSVAESGCYHSKD